MQQVDACIENCDHMLGLLQLLTANSSPCLWSSKLRKTELINNVNDQMFNVTLQRTALINYANIPWHLIPCPLLESWRRKLCAPICHQHRIFQVYSQQCLSSSPPESLNQMLRVIFPCPLLESWHRMLCAPICHQHRIFQLYSQQCLSSSPPESLNQMLPVIFPCPLLESWHQKLAEFSTATYLQIFIHSVMYFPIFWH